MQRIMDIQELRYIWPGFIESMNGIGPPELQATAMNPELLGGKIEARCSYGFKGRRDLQNGFAYVELIRRRSRHPIFAPCWLCESMHLHNILWIAPIAKFIAVVIGGNAAVFSEKPVYENRGTLVAM